MRGEDPGPSFGGRGRRGASLGEVILATALFAVGVLGGLGVLAVAARTLARAEALSRAAALGEDVLDSLLLHRVGGAGVRSGPGIQVRWTAEAGGGLRTLRLRVHSAPGVAASPLLLEALHDDSLLALPPPEGRAGVP